MNIHFPLNKFSLLLSSEETRLQDEDLGVFLLETVLHHQRDLLESRGRLLRAFVKGGR
jgi:hypothetical protein